MNGKELKVAELELTYGVRNRFVNVFGVFKYKPNGNLYVIYADVNTNNDYVCYGTAHIKNGSILSMHPNKPEDVEAIKEYIFKITSGEPLDNFEICSLDEVNEIEIISSKNFEIKQEVLNSLIEKTIPPKKDKTEDEKGPNNKKKKRKPFIFKVLFLLLIVIVGVIAYSYYEDLKEQEKIAKAIYCTKSYYHKELNNVVVDEEKTFLFNNYEQLAELHVKTKFNFNNSDDYLDFIAKSLNSKYLPTDDEDTKSSFELDDTNKTYITETTTKIDESYTEVINYEEVLGFYTKDNYSCEEKIVK